eukprot:scaffold123653_cov15-Tisochrysis_lutea.AAC.1
MDERRAVGGIDRGRPNPPCDVNKPMGGNLNISGGKCTTRRLPGGDTANLTTRSPRSAPTKAAASSFAIVATVFFSFKP